MMFYHDLHATSGRKKDTSPTQTSKSNKVTERATDRDSQSRKKNKKKKSAIIMREDIATLEQDDDCCETMCVTVPAVGLGALAVYSLLASESYKVDARMLSDATESIWEAGAKSGFVGAAIGKGAHTCYRLCFPKKEKQD
jgi:hypothetical protein